MYKRPDKKNRYSLLKNNSRTEKVMWLQSMYHVNEIKLFLLFPELKSMFHVYEIKLLLIFPELKSMYHVYEIKLLLLFPELKSMYHVYEIKLSLSFPVILGHTVQVNTFPGLLCKHFPGKVIPIIGDVECPARSNGSPPLAVPFGLSKYRNISQK